MLRRSNRNVEQTGDSASADAPDVEDCSGNQGDVKAKRSSKRKINAEVEMVELLEDRVLGGGQKTVRKLLKIAASDSGKSDEESEGLSSDDEAPVEQTSKRIVAWVDEDDFKDVSAPKGHRLHQLKRSTDSQTISGEQYNARLKEHFEKSTGLCPKWAQLPTQLEKSGRSKKFEDSDEDSGSESLLDLNKGSTKYLADSGHLPNHQLNFKRLRDPTFGYRSRVPLKTVEFSRKTNVLMTAGVAGRCSLFKIDGGDNPLLQSANLDNFPISCARFSMDGRSVFLASNAREQFCRYDLMTAQLDQIPFPKGIRRQSMPIFDASADGKYLAFCGKFGDIHVLSAQSTEWVKTFKMNDHVNAVVFSPVDYGILYTFGSEGQVYVWDIRSRDCLHKFHDEGVVQGESMAVSPNGRYLACGSNTGIVNIYETSATHKQSDPKPIKVVDNLTTSADWLRFNHDSELLAVGSSLKDSSVRLVRLRSGTVYENFPEKFSRLRKVFCGDFSPHGAYMAYGNDVGQAMLFKLHHYDQY